MMPDRISRKAVCTGINSDESSPIISKNKLKSEAFSRLETDHHFVIELSHWMPVTLR
jgi:hypothetical protein